VKESAGGSVSGTCKRISGWQRVKESAGGSVSGEGVYDLLAKDWDVLGNPCKSVFAAVPASR
jgi:hypothetical protein